MINFIKKKGIKAIIIIQITIFAVILKRAIT